jgi:hypothetical protein
VRATAERHGGRATAEAATFALELPLAAPSQFPQGPRVEHPVSPDAKGMR